MWTYKGVHSYPDCVLDVRAYQSGIDIIRCERRHVDWPGPGACKFLNFPREIYSMDVGL